MAKDGEPGDYFLHTRPLCSLTSGRKEGGNRSQINFVHLGK